MTPMDLATVGEMGCVLRSLLGTSKRSEFAMFTSKELRTGFELADVTDGADTFGAFGGEKRLGAGMMAGDRRKFHNTQRF